MCVRGFRGANRRTRPDAKLIPHIMWHFPQVQMRIRPNAKGPLYEDAVKSHRLQTCRVDPAFYRPF